MRCAVIFSCLVASSFASGNDDGVSLLQVTAKMLGGQPTCLKKSFQGGCKDIDTSGWIGAKDSPESCMNGCIARGLEDGTTYDYIVVVPGNCKCLVGCENQGYMEQLVYSYGCDIEPVKHKQGFFFASTFNKDCLDVCEENDSFCTGSVGGSSMTFDTFGWYDLVNTEEKALGVFASHGFTCPSAKWSESGFVVHYDGRLPTGSECYLPMPSGRYECGREAGNYRQMCWCGPGQPATTTTTTQPPTTTTTKAGGEPMFPTPVPTPAKVCRKSCHRGEYIKKKSCSRVTKCGGCCECTGECEPKRKPPREKKCKDKCYRKRGEKSMKKHMCYKNKCGACPECAVQSFLEASANDEDADEDEAADDVEDDDDDDDDDDNDDDDDDDGDLA